jgi:TATA-box binding protein (TBP) (component of TFIID and TFIIIB)
MCEAYRERLKVELPLVKWVHDRDADALPSWAAHPPGDGCASTASTASTASHSVAAAAAPVATSYFVSTVTVVSSLGTAVDTQTLFDVAELDASAQPLLGGDGGETLQALSVQLATQVRDAQGARALEDKKKKKRGFFGNQTTLVFEFRSPRAPSDPKRIHVKVFRNGSLQLAGVRDLDHGPRLVAHVVGRLRDLAARHPELAAEPSLMVMGPCSNVLINANFDVGMCLRRERLQECVRDVYGTVCSFEPCIYPGMKIKYMWNDAAPLWRRDGVCRCRAVSDPSPPMASGKAPPGGRHKGKASLPCSGAGDGHSEGRCRKVTIGVFRSGKSMITGAQSIEQVDAAYDFLTKVVLARHHGGVRMPPLPPKTRVATANSTPKPAKKKSKAKKAADADADADAATQSQSQLVSTASDSTGAAQWADDADSGVRASCEPN